MCSINNTCKAIRTKLTILYLNNYYNLNVNSENVFTICVLMDPKIKHINPETCWLRFFSFISNKLYHKLISVIPHYPIYTKVAIDQLILFRAHWSFLRWSSAWIRILRTNLCAINLETLKQTYSNISYYLEGASLNVA